MVDPGSKEDHVFITPRLIWQVVFEVGESQKSLSDVNIFLWILSVGTNLTSLCNDCFLKSVTVLSLTPCPSERLGNFYDGGGGNSGLTRYLGLLITPL